MSEDECQDKAWDCPHSVTRKSIFPRPPVRLPALCTDCLFFVSKQKLAIVKAMSTYAESSVWLTTRFSASDHRRKSKRHVSSLRGGRHNPRENNQIQSDHRDGYLDDSWRPTTYQTALANTISFDQYASIEATSDTCDVGMPR